MNLERPDREVQEFLHPSANPADVNPAQIAPFFDMPAVAEDIGASDAPALEVLSQANHAAVCVLSARIGT